MRTDRQITVVSPAFRFHFWSQTFARAIAPRKHLRVLPTRTRPSLFGSD